MSSTWRRSDTAVIVPTPTGWAQGRMLAWYRATPDDEWIGQVDYASPGTRYPGLLELPASSILDATACAHCMMVTLRWGPARHLWDQPMSSETN